MHVAALWIYPVKGLRGIALDAAQVEVRGLQHDRRWLVVDAAGNFLSQRSHPAMARITVAVLPGGIRLQADGAGSLDVPQPDGSERRNVTIWSDDVDAAVAGPAAAEFLSAVLGDPVALVYQDAPVSRLRHISRLGHSMPVSFADAYPVLVTQEASLAALNDDIVAHGHDSVPMERFRPNIVLAGDAPAWAEDGWQRLRIGAGVVLELVKPCARCVVTTTDPWTGERRGPEPLAALGRLRRATDPKSDGGVLFGVNAVPTAGGLLRVGDAVVAE